MSKEWKCGDCVKFKTDACSTCACGYIPTVSCRDVLVDFDYAYQQGRADAIEEIKSLIFEFDDYCDGRECSDCWMNISDDSCLKQWINSKLEQLKG